MHIFVMTKHSHSHIGDPLTNTTAKGDSAKTNMAMNSNMAMNYQRRSIPKVTMLAKTRRKIMFRSLDVYLYKISEA